MKPPAPPATEKKPVKGKVGIVVSGSVGADFLPDAISKALQVKGITGAVVSTVGDNGVLPYAVMNMTKTCDVVIGTCCIVADASGGAAASLNSSLMQIGLNGKVPIIPAIVSQSSLLEVKATLPFFAEEWANAVVGILGLKTGLVSTPAPVHEIKEKPVLTPELDNVDTLMDVFRETLKSRGARGIAGLSRKFKIADDDNSGSIDFNEFKKCISEHALNWQPAQLKAVFDKFDDDKSGSISFDEFLIGVRGALNERRKQLVLLAFDILDADKSGVVELNDIQAKYDASKHPDVKTGKRTSAEVLSEFLDTFDTEEKDGKVTPSEFCKYYSNVSSSIDDDDYFELMIRNAWHISGGEGWCANSSNRRVLVTHTDGRQTVQEIKNDLGIKGDDKEAMLKNLQDQGIDDIVSIEVAGQSSAAPAAAAAAAAAPASPAKAKAAHGDVAGYKNPNSGGEQAVPRRRVGGQSSIVIG